MKLLSLCELLKKFEGKNSKTFGEFIENAHVKSGDRLIPLKQYIKQNGIYKSDLRLLYEHILNRDEYLTRFYNTSLYVKQFHITDEPMTVQHLDNNKLVNYKNFIRNIHFTDILKNTKSGINNIPTFLDVLFDLYLKEIIDYKILTPSAIHYMNHGRIGSVFSSFYFRASIMNPYLVYSLNMSLFKSERIFTPTLGWCSYAYGFLECPFVKEYVGVDVIPAVCSKTMTVCNIYSLNIKTEIYCQPSESLWKNARFIKSYKEHFDLVFFSPPYYELELYPGKNQSTTMYKTYEKWLSGYWEETIRLCSYVLQKKGVLSYVLSSGGGNIRANILKDMNQITKKYFKQKMIIPMYNKNVHVTAKNHRETSEYIMVFMK